MLINGDLSRELEKGKLIKKKQKNIKMVAGEENVGEDMVVWFSG